MFVCFLLAAELGAFVCSMIICIGLDIELCVHAENVTINTIHSTDINKKSVRPADDARNQTNNAYFMQRK